MDESKAIELLRQALTKIPKLKKLHYNNQEFKLWCARVETIIKKGLDADDYERLDFVQSKYFLDDIVDIGIEQSEDYPKKLKDYETALKSIIQKYELIGIETKPTPIGKSEEVSGDGEGRVKMDLYNELSSFREVLKDYKSLLSKLQPHQPLPADYQSHRENILINSSNLVSKIKTLTGKDESLVIYEMGKPRTVDMWQMGLRNEYDYRTVAAINACVDNVTLAIGKLMNDISEGIRDEQGNVIGDTATDIAKSPIDLFDAMQFHPKVVKASKLLFETGNYASAILEAFKAVNIFVKEKSGLSKNALRGVKDRQLMAKVFDEKVPLIKLNELITDTDFNEQEGFKLLFMGATEGIRNPKAHDLIEMKDPYRTLEYLGFASLLMHKISFWKVE